MVKQTNLLLSINEYLAILKVDSLKQSSVLHSLNTYTYLYSCNNDLLVGYTLTLNWII